jgi:hypothetical protein
MENTPPTPPKMVTVRIAGRRATCTIRHMSLHTLVWMLTSNGCDVELQLPSETEAVVVPETVTLEAFDAVLQQARDTEIVDLYHDISMVHTLLCAHLGAYDSDD